MIYALRNPRIASELARISAGPFTTEQLTRCLERTREFRALDTDDAKQASLDMLDLCKICVRSGRDRWVAIQRELLSDGNAALEVQKAANLEWKRVAAESDGAETDRMVNHSFALYGDQGDLLGDSDYREVLAYVARGLWDAVPRRLFGDDEGGERVGGASESRFHDRIGYEATPWFWRDGFTVTWARPAGERRSPTDRLVLKVEWAPSIEPESGRPAYEGRLLVELLSRDENTYASRLRAVLLDSGPLALFKDKIVISDTRPQGLSADQMPLPRGDGQPDWSHRPTRRGAKPRHDVAISYRGSDEKVAQRVRKALTLAGIDVYSYSEDQRDRDRAEEKLDSITDVYDHLKYARSLVVVASPAYFETPVFDKNSRTPDIAAKKASPLRG